LTLSIDTHVMPRHDFAVARDPAVLAAVRPRGMRFALWLRNLPADITHALQVWMERASLHVDTIVCGDSLTASVPELARLPQSG
jgi:hypothetical protein